MNRIHRNFNQEFFKNNESNALSLSQLDIIIKQMKKSVCKIKINNFTGTGFFCYIPFDYIDLPVLVTSHHILNEKNISIGKAINISLNDNEFLCKLFIDESRITYSNEKYDITFIEIKNNDNLFMVSFLNIDKEIIKKEEYIYKNISIYNIHYPSSKIVKFSISKILKTDEFKLFYLSSTQHGSSGSPILNISNNQVIALHKGFIKKFGEKLCNYGILIKWAIEDFKLKKKKKNGL